MLNLFLVLLTILFIFLKLTATITWSWIWVLAPLWIPLAFGAIVATFVFIIGLFVVVKGKRTL